MQFLIGIVPSEEICYLVNQLRSNWGYEATEPHITIKSPEGLNNMDKWLNHVKNIIHNFTKLDIQIGGVGFFNQSVLFYQVQSARIKELHFKLAKAVYPTTENLKTNFELHHYIPHLTIMKHKEGFEELPLDEIAIEAEQLLKENDKFTQEFVRIYSRQNSKENFNKFLDVSLA